MHAIIAERLCTLGQEAEVTGTLTVSGFGGTGTILTEATGGRVDALQLTDIPTGVTAGGVWIGVVEIPPESALQAAKAASVANEMLDDGGTATQPVD